MPKIPVNIGTLRFDAKGDALLFLKEMLNRYSPGDKVSPDDERVLRDALKNHPDFEKKIGCGIDYFTVARADFGTQCFWINRTDGTDEKFSYKYCV